MKFTAVFALIAAVSAVQINGADPVTSAKARETTLDTSRSVVAEQHRFEAEHLDMHLNNLKEAADQCQTVKTTVRAARSKQVAGGDQYAEQKTYKGSGGGATKWDDGKE